MVDELREISTALMGTVDIVAKPDDLEADFEAMMQAAMSRGVPDARLRIWTPQGSEVLFVRQVAPTVEDMQRLAELMSSGTVLPVIDRRYALSEAAAAIRYLEQGRARGKVVVTLE